MSTTSYQGLLASSIVLPILDIVIVGLRFYVRSTQRSKLRLDDWLQIPVLTIFIGIAITAIIGLSENAYGHPTPMDEPPSMPPESLTQIEKVWFVVQLIQIPCLALSKIAALLFYKRLFVTSKGLLEYIIWFLIVLTTVWCIAMMVFYLSACGTHLPDAWSGWLGFAEYCMKTEYFEQGYAISDFLLDTFVLLVPLPSIWRLHTTTARKVGITSVFLVAFIGYGASIARLVFFVRLAQNALTDAVPDIGSTDTQATWFTNLEIGLAILALNLPSIWGLISKASVNSMVQSMRSLVSLPGSSRGASTQRSNRDPSWAYQSSQSHHAPEKFGQSDSSGYASPEPDLAPYPEPDVEMGRPHYGPKIMVERHFEMVEGRIQPRH